MRETPDAIRAFYQAYHERDRAAASALMDEGFTFTSPYDEALGKAEYFQRCWEPGSHHVAFEEERLIADGEGAFLTYLVTLDDGRSFRNTEYFEVREGRILSVTVYFGATYRNGAYEAQSPAG
ncbi:nuclear transport factor 2 family protein [Sphingomonas sp. HF-S3]|uniref:Nuclear transport factor 2 family protein n=1 Tax=Sphingomonas rustica TaxID=3103142 RepID=A0ABV0BCP9_9SPHN